MEIFAREGSMIPPKRRNHYVILILPFALRIRTCSRLKSILYLPRAMLTTQLSLRVIISEDIHNGCCCAMVGQTICGDHMGTKSMYSPHSLNVYPTYNPAPHNILNRPMGKVLQLSGDDVESMLIAPNKLSMKKMLVECW